MLSRFGVTTAASGSLPTIQEQWPAGRITTGIAMPRSCMLRPRVRTSGTRNNSRRATVPRSMTAGDLTQSRTVGGHFLGLRAAALALRVLGLRAAALALRVLGLRAAALALRVLGLRAAALALRVLGLRAAALLRG